MKFVVALLVVVVASACGTAPPKATYDNAPYFSIAGTSKAGAPKPPPATNVYTFDDEVTEESTKAVIAWINARREAGATTVRLNINTPGGSVFDGIALSKVMESSGLRIRCFVDGYAMSMGFYLLQSCTERYMSKRSVLMVHEPASGGLVYGPETEWQNNAEFLRVLRRAIVEHCAARMKLSADALEARISGGKEWYMDHRAALESGSIDSVGS